MSRVEATFCRYESPVSTALSEEVLELSETIFGSDDRLDRLWRINHMPRLTVFGAKHDDRLVALKIGYAITSRRYYSWLGGVHPEFRRLGLARKLMQLQHEWIGANGYSVVETKVMQENKAMRDLNAAAGFVQLGKEMSRDSSKLILRKNVDRNLNRE